MLSGTQRHLARKACICSVGICKALQPYGGNDDQMILESNGQKALVALTIHTMDGSRWMALSAFMTVTIGGKLK